MRVGSCDSKEMGGSTSSQTVWPKGVIQVQLANASLKYLTKLVGGTRKHIVTRFFCTEESAQHTSYTEAIKRHTLNSTTPTCGFCVGQLHENHATMRIV